MNNEREFKSPDAEQSALSAPGISRSGELSPQGLRENRLGADASLINSIERCDSASRYHIPNDEGVGRSDCAAAGAHSSDFQLSGVNPDSSNGLGGTGDDRRIGIMAVTSAEVPADWTLSAWFADWLRLVGRAS
jgi:hypothetical protein